MTIQAVVEYVEKSRRNLLQAARMLSTEDFLRRKPGVFSVRDLLVHMMDAEDYWVGTVILGGRHQKFNPEKYENIGSVFADWEVVHERTRRLLDGISDARLNERITVRWDKPVTIDVRKALWQVLVHEIHHRGQICMLMREQGYDPPDVELL